MALVYTDENGERQVRFRGSTPEALKGLAPLPTELLQKKYSRKGT